MTGLYQLLFSMVITEGIGHKWASWHQREMGRLASPLKLVKVKETYEWEQPHHCWKGQSGLLVPTMSWRTLQLETHLSASYETIFCGEHPFRFIPDIWKKTKLPPAIPAFWNMFVTSVFYMYSFIYDIFFIMFFLWIILCMLFLFFLFRYIGFC